MTTSPSEAIKLRANHFFRAARKTGKPITRKAARDLAEDEYARQHPLWARERQQRRAVAGVMKTLGPPTW